MTQYVWDTGMPFWAVFLAFAMAAVYVIPVGTVFAVANLNSNVLTVLGEIISGYLLPGKPIVMLIFKVWICQLVSPFPLSRETDVSQFYAYTGLSQAMNYSSDMKACHLITP
jgi:hypothetical protein